MAYRGFQRAIDGCVSTIAAATANSSALRAVYCDGYRIAICIDFELALFRKIRSPIEKEKKIVKNNIHLKRTIS